MNTNSNNNRREELEARIVAMLLGEANESEKAELEAEIQKNTELADYYKQMEQTIHLIKESLSAQNQTSEAGDNAALNENQDDNGKPQTLSPKRREVLLKFFNKPRKKLKKQAEQKKVSTLNVAVRLAAVFLILSIIAALLLPSMTKAKAKAQRTSEASIRKQTEFELQMLQEEMSEKQNRQPQMAGEVAAGQSLSFNAPQQDGAQSQPEVNIGRIYLPNTQIAQSDVKYAQSDRQDNAGKNWYYYNQGQVAGERQSVVAGQSINGLQTFGRGEQSVGGEQAFGRRADVGQSEMRTRFAGVAGNAESSGRQSGGFGGGGGAAGFGFNVADNKSSFQRGVQQLGDYDSDKTVGDNFETVLAKQIQKGQRQNQQLGVFANVADDAGIDDFYGANANQLQADRITMFADSENAQRQRVGGKEATAVQEGKQTIRGNIVTEQLPALKPKEQGIPVPVMSSIEQPKVLAATATVPPATPPPTQLPSPQKVEEFSKSKVSSSSGITAERELGTTAGKPAVEMEIAGQTKPMGRAVVLDESKVMPQRSSKDALEKRDEKKTPLSTTSDTLARKRLAEQPIQQKTEEVADKAEPASTPTPASPLVHQLEINTAENRFSTFSLNVSDVSFKLAAASLERNQLPNPYSIRVEEFVNAFNYNDPAPAPGARIGFFWERAQYPFAHNREIVRFSVKTAAQGRDANKPMNIVILLDNSGSMERPDRIMIIREAMSVLAEKLRPQDKVSVVAFSRSARLVVDGMSGAKTNEFLASVLGLNPGGGTNLEEAMRLAYETALRHFIPGGINRIILLTDGAANLGDVNPESLKKMVTSHRHKGIALDCFGIGWEGYNDELLEILSRNGDGRYGFMNEPEQAPIDFAQQLAGALSVAASDVKVQVEFNPDRVISYRQIGYAKHQLTKEQFRNNMVDAAEIAAEESGNALYLIEVNQQGSGNIAVFRVRYKVPETGDYVEQEWTLPYTGSAPSLDDASPSMRLAATAATFGEWLSRNPYAGQVELSALERIMVGIPQFYAPDERPKQLLSMIRQARAIIKK